MGIEARRSACRCAAALALALVLAPPAAAASGSSQVTLWHYWKAPPARPAALAPQTQFQRVKPSFWAYTAIRWSVLQGWVKPKSSSHFGCGSRVSRAAAAKVLVLAHAQQTATPPPRHPYRVAVAAGWIRPGSGPAAGISQSAFDRGIVRMLGLQGASDTYKALATADGYRPGRPAGFSAEQIVRHLGLRVNAPAGSDTWEWWPKDRLVRTELAVEAYQLAHMPSWAPAWATSQTSVAGQLPAWTPLQRQVLSYAIRYAGAPYVWGGASNRPQRPLGLAAVGGFDCSGFVWWVLRLHSYRLTDGSSWNASKIITARTTYGMTAALPVKRRVGYAHLRPGDVLFWSDVKPNGVHTSWTHIYHTGIYLGGGWTINSHGGGDGVTIDQMTPGSGWFYNYFAFGWHVLPSGQ